MEVHLPAFNYGLLWLILLVQLIVAGVVGFMLWRVWKMEPQDIIKGGTLFIIVAMVVSSLGMWSIQQSFDESVRVTALENQGYEYIAVDGNVWIAVKDDLFYRGIFERKGPDGSERWVIRVLPDAE